MCTRVWASFIELHPVLNVNLQNAHKSGRQTFKPVQICTVSADVLEMNCFDGRSSSLFFVVYGLSPVVCSNLQ
jgi:hypothetical protein